MPAMAKLTGDRLNADWPAGRARDAGRSRSEAQRTRVVEAAIAAIFEKGPERVTMRDVARLAGMSPGHVTYYFSSRDSILMESLRWSEQELADIRSVALSRARSPWPRIIRFIDLYLPGSARDLRWNLWNQIQARPPTDEGSLNLLATILRRWENDLATAIQTGIEGGSFTVASDPNRLANLLRLLLDGIALEITLNCPGRNPQWGRKLAAEEFSRQLLPR